MAWTFKDEAGTNGARTAKKLHKRIKRLEGLLESLADAIEAEGRRGKASYPDESVLLVAKGIRAALHE